MAGRAEKPVAAEDLPMGSLSIWHWIIVLLVVMVLFGGRGKISSLMGDFAQGIKAFKKGMSEEFQGQFQEAMREAEMADFKKQAEDLKTSVSDLTNFDPMVNTQKEIERAFEMPEPGKAAEVSTESAPATPSALPEPAQQSE